MADVPDTWSALPIGEPARRALRSAGLTDLDDLHRLSEAEVASLHGIGPKALAVLTAELAKRGLQTD